MSDAGNTLETATLLQVGSSTQSISNSVSPSDLNDYYRFTLNYRSSFNLALTNLSGDANVELLTSSGSLLSINGVPQRSNNTGTLAESLNTILDAGTYCFVTA
jgi:hypothetical protein